MPSSLKSWLGPVLFVLTAAGFWYMSHLGERKRAEAQQNLNAVQQELIAQQNTEKTAALSQMAELSSQTLPLVEQTPNGKVKAAQSKQMLDKMRASVSKASEVSKSLIQTPTGAVAAANANAATYEIYMPGIVSGVIGLAALVMVFRSKTDPEARKWAFGILGTIIGYWLRTGS